jgi:hypothetical protein
MRLRGARKSPFRPQSLLGAPLALLLLAGAACSAPAWTTLTGKVLMRTMPCPAMPPGRCAIVVATPVPAANVTVTAVASPGKQRFTARTGSDGRFSLGLPGGDFDVYAASIRMARVTMVGYPAEKRYLEVTLPYAPPAAGFRPSG